MCFFVAIPILIVKQRIMDKIIQRLAVWIAVL